MDNLNLSKSRLQIINYLILVSAIILLHSCKKEDNSDNTYLGKPNTIREYETTTWRFEANTDIPLIKVPVSSYKKLSFDTILISKGVVLSSYSTERLVPYNTSSRLVTNPDLFIGAIQIISNGEQYDLEKDLEKISNNEEYSLTNIGGSIGVLWYEDGQQLSNIFNDTNKYVMLKKPLHVGDEWIRESRRYKNSNGDYELFQQECKVIGKELVEVKAGKFSAFKIEVMNHWVDLNSTSIRMYEYYAPEVGLILEESDGNIYQAILTPDGGSSTSFFHQKVRKELANYSFARD